MMHREAIYRDPCIILPYRINGIEKLLDNNLVYMGYRQAIFVLKAIY